MVFFFGMAGLQCYTVARGGGDMKLLHESQLKIMFASNLNYAFSSLLGNYIQPQQFILTRNQLGYLWL